MIFVCYSQHIDRCRFDIDNFLNIQRTWQGPQGSPLPAIQIITTSPKESQCTKTAVRSQHDWLRDHFTFCGQFTPLLFNIWCLGALYIGHGFSVTRTIHVDQNDMAHPFLMPYMLDHTCKIGKPTRVTSTRARIFLMCNNIFGTKIQLQCHKNEMKVTKLSHLRLISKSVYMALSQWLCRLGV